MSTQSQPSTAQWRLRVTYHEGNRPDSSVASLLSVQGYDTDAEVFEALEVWSARTDVYIMATHYYAPGETLPEPKWTLAISGRNPASNRPDSNALPYDTYEEAHRDWLGMLGSTSFVYTAATIYAPEGSGEKHVRLLG